MYAANFDDIEIPDFKIGEMYELWTEVKLVVLTDDHMIIIAPFGTIDVTKSEISGLWTV